MSFSMSAASQVAVEVFDIQGKRIRTFSTGFQQAGTHAVSWDCMNSGGHRVRPGIYRMSIKFDGMRRTTNVVVL